MINDFYDTCYELCSLSTCILSNNDLEQRNAKITIKITDNLVIEAIYSYYYNLVSDLEKHGFYLDFYKDGNYIGCTRYSKFFQGQKYGSLARRNMKKTKKEVAIMKTCKPSVLDKTMKLPEVIELVNKLSYEEKKAFYLKTSELLEAFKDLSQENVKRSTR